MVPSNLRKLLRIQSQSAVKAFTEFRGPISPFPPSALTPIPQIPNSIDALPFSELPKSDFSKRDNVYVYPSFSMGLFLTHPISPTSLVRSELDDEVISDDSNVIRADSVKKKRKKKMNKHKLNKLRKRLRRKT